MHRTQLLLEDWQYQALKAASERRRVSISQLVREIVTRYLDDAGDESKLYTLEGIGTDATSRARDHDAFLYGRKPRDKKR